MSMILLGGVELAFASATSTGPKHDVNEDSVGVVPPVFVVADGVSGGGRGQEASGAAVTALSQALADGLLDADGVRSAVQAADRDVRALSGPATTVSGVVLAGRSDAPIWVVLNVGDSRVYRYEQGALERLTVDHVPVREPGRWSGKHAAHGITRALGAANATPDVSVLPVTSGERLLLCTDGVHGVLPDETLRAALTVGGTPDSVSQALVRLAVRGGARDDATVVVIDVRAGGLRPGDRYETTGGATYEDDTIEVAR